MKYLLLMSVAALSVGLTGCGGGGSSFAEGDDSLGDTNAPLCLDTAIPFDYDQLDTFLVSENLNRTGSWDYLHAIVPNNADNISVDQQAVIDFMSEKVNLDFSAEGVPNIEDGITSFDNAIDTMEKVIASEEVGNINSGRMQMLQAIKDNVTCSYNNTAAYLRDSDDNLLYYIVRFNHVSASTREVETLEDGKVIKETISIPAKVEKVLIEYKLTEQINKDGETVSVGNVTSTSLSIINPSTFSSSGFNQPLTTIIDFIGSGNTLKVTKDFQEQIDRTEYKSSTAFSIGSDSEIQNIKRLKLSVDYQTREVNMFASDFINAVQCKDGTILKDPTISSSDITIEDENLELTVPGLEGDGEAVGDTCEEPTAYYDPNYDYNPVTEAYPESILPMYTGSEVTSRQ